MKIATKRSGCAGAAQSPEHTKQGTGRIRRNIGTQAGAVALGVLVFALAGCGSSGSNSADGTGAPSGSGDSAVLAAAKAVEQASTATTTLPVTTPLSGAAPKGKTVAYLKGDTPQSEIIEQGIDSAAAAVGWHVKSISFSYTSPTSITSALNTVLQSKPDAVYLAGIPEVFWKAQAPAIAKAGIAIVSSVAGTLQDSSNVIANLVDDDTYTQMGQIQGNWVVADSKGKAQVLILHDPAYPTLTAAAVGAKKTIETECSACKVTDGNITVADVAAGKTGGQVVSILQRNPGIKYVVSPYGNALDGITAALRSAGLRDVKVSGESISTALQAQIKSGNVQGVGVGFGLKFLSWQAMDAILRHSLGMKFPLNDGGFPLVLLTKDNITEPTESTDTPTDYQEQFKKLWGVS